MINLQSVRCIRCGEKTQYAKTQSKPTDGLVTVYCKNINGKNHGGRRIKIRVITKLNIPRIIRSDRMKSSKDKDESFHMRDLICICGKELWFEKKTSHAFVGKVSSRCSSSTHKLKVTILSKIMNEPDFDELMEIILTEITE